MHYNKLCICTVDNREFKIYPLENDSVSDDNQSSTDPEDPYDSIPNVIHEILTCYCSNIQDVFPSVTIK